jgi:hypothetical protein
MIGTTSPSAFATDFGRTGWEKVKHSSRLAPYIGWNDQSACLKIKARCIETLSTGEREG